MRRLQTILVALDGSEPSLNALDWAIRCVRGRSGTIHLLHGYEPSPWGGAAGSGLLPGYESALRRSAQDWLDDLAHRVASEGIRVEIQLVAGAPASAIVETATRIGADLIAMGTRGRSGLAQVLLGSVAQRTIQRAPCPVVAVPPEKSA